MKNIEKFNKLTAQILTTLYENFPRKIDLSPDDFSKDMTREDRLYFIDTVMWLAENGYISYDFLDNYGNFINTDLTEKGFIVLNSTIHVDTFSEAISMIPKIIIGGKR